SLSNSLANNYTSLLAICFQVHLTVLEYSITLQTTTPVCSISTTTLVCLITAQPITTLIHLIIAAISIALQITNMSI
ncbi:15049_t:CDS:2, partial [Funneliformis mosseae]